MIFNNTDELQESFAKCGLEVLGQSALTYCLPAIIGHTELSAGVLESAISKMGGFPDVPKDFQWPFAPSDPYDETSTPIPLWFIGQLNLGNIRHSLPSYFPTHGLISFWAAVSRFPFEGQSHGWKVYRFDEYSLSRLNAHPVASSEFVEEIAAWGLNANGVPLLKEARLHLQPCVALPSDWFYKNRNKSEGELYIQHRLTVGAMSLSINGKHLFGGYPQMIKMGHEQALKMAQAASQIKYLPNSSVAEKRHQDALDFKLWNLLAHFDPDANIELMWPYSGRGHFFVRKNSLESGDVNGAVLISDTW